MRYTFAEMLTELLKRNNMSTYIQQANGSVSWMWMGGENNSMVSKGQLEIHNLYTMRKAFAAIREATIMGWPPAQKFNRSMVERTNIPQKKITFKSWTLSARSKMCVRRSMYIKAGLPFNCFSY